LNCNTNSIKNLRLIDGTLAITAIYEKILDKEIASAKSISEKALNYGKYLNKEFTSGKIITKEAFTYGKFEIRAALPKGKMLKPAIYMIPKTIENLATNGQINIMTNIQNNILGAGLHCSNNPAHHGFNTSGVFSTDANLNDFHNYSTEWNMLEIKWFFDDNNYLTKNTSRILGPVYSKNTGVSFCF
jgi:beta-glucanase (GH16 family)